MQSINWFLLVIIGYGETDFFVEIVLVWLIWSADQRVVDGVRKRTTEDSRTYWQVNFCCVAFVEQKPHNSGTIKRTILDEGPGGRHTIVLLVGDVRDEEEEEVLGDRHRKRRVHPAPEGDRVRQARLALVLLVGQPALLLFVRLGLSCRGRRGRRAPLS